MIIRLSQKLATKIKSGALSEVPLHEREIADWSATLFNVGRTQYVLLSNTPSLFTCLMIAKGLTNSRLFEHRAAEVIGDVVRRFWQNHNLGITEFHSPFSYAKSLNRSVIGSMNDLVFGARLIIEGGIDLQEAADRLNTTPLKALTNRDGRRYANPSEVFRRIIEDA